MTVSATGMSSRYASRDSKDSSSRGARGRVGVGVRPGETRQGFRHSRRERIVVRGAEDLDELGSLPVFTEDQPRKRRCVGADRRVALGGVLLERPACVDLRAVPVPGQDPSLQGADQPAPASGRRVWPALAVALRRPGEPARRLRIASLHETGEPCSARGHGRPHQLLLARIRVVRHPRERIRVARLFPLRVLVPAHARSVASEALTFPFSGDGTERICRRQLS